MLRLKVKAYSVQHLINQWGVWSRIKMSNKVSQKHQRNRKSRKVRRVVAHLRHLQNQKQNQSLGLGVKEREEDRDQDQGGEKEGIEEIMTETEVQEGESVGQETGEVVLTNELATSLCDSLQGIEEMDLLEDEMIGEVTEGEMIEDEMRGEGIEGKISDHTINENQGGLTPL